MAGRLAAIGRHIAEGSERPITAWEQRDPSEEAMAKADINRKGPLHVKMRANILEYWDQLDDESAIDGYDCANHLPGPHSEIGRRYPSKREILREMAAAGVLGLSHVKWEELQQRYCEGNHTANVVVPYISFTRFNRSPPKLTNLVLLSDPADCARIARDHVKKMPDQALFLGGGVLSTTDTASWRAQRSHFAEAFLPRHSLAKLLPINCRRAQASMANLPVRPGGEVVNMNEFLLHEAMAQLQLSLFGLPESFMADTNKKLRGAFDTITAGTGITSGGDSRYLDTSAVRAGAAYANTWLTDFLQHADEKSDIAFEAAERAETGDGAATAAPPDGPLSALIADSDEPVPNAATFVFAGHDTTANTMTWLLYEVAQRPDLQRDLQGESDALFARVGGSTGIQYAGLAESLPLLGRCLTETLRLWPAVPNGTFRELMADEHIRGPDGSKVLLKKGTYCQVTTWTRHRSAELWGADVDTWNPHRAFTERELAFGVSTSGVNPASERFSPFTYPPRDCIGKNFAMMEMRIILAHLFHNFSFDLAEPVKSRDFEKFRGINRGTMGPQDLGTPVGAAPSLAMPMHVTPRRPSAV